MKAPSIRSFWSRSIITTSAPSSAASKSVHALTPIASMAGGISVPGATTRTSAASAVRARIFDRATRLCSTSPQITTRWPAIAPRRRRIVSASSSAWVGCSWRPSPALSTGQSTLPAMSCTAPELWWRMTIASARIAFSVIAVSISVSPFFTLDWAACMLTTSAPSRLPAISNESSVRVLFSKKALMTVSPASRPSLLARLRLIATHASASSSRKAISWGWSPAMPVRCRCGNTARPAISVPGR